MFRRSFAVLMLVALVATLAVMPTAHAQAPSTDTCGPLELTIAQPSTATPAGGTGTFTVTVENRGRLTAIVTVVASTDAAGWRITSPSEQDASIVAAESKAYPFAVSPDEGAAAEASVNFLARAVCDFGPVPCTTDAPPCASRSQPATGVATFAPAEGLRIPGLDSLALSPGLILGGGLLFVAVMLIPLLAKKRRGGILATCPEPLKLLKPGHGVNFPIQIANRGKNPLRATFTVEGEPAGWTAFMAMPDIQLAAGEMRSVWLMVRAPQTAALGDVANFTLIVQTATDERLSVRVRAEVDGAAPTE